MPRQKSITVYKFDELSEDAKEKAIWELSGINVDHDWHEHIYDGAKEIGLIITEFDVYRNTINGHIRLNVPEVCKLIRKHHDKESETYKTAVGHLNQYIEEFKKYRDKYRNEFDNPVHALEGFEDEDEAEDILCDFEKTLLEEYLIILRKEYEYLTSDEAIIESIEANEYEFNENGCLA
jgi:hypothetical protein